MRKQISFSQRRDIGEALRNARLAHGLAQRELGDRVGLPQSHISKIEQGAVDLQFSSLSELARALGLEVKLVPRQALPAVEGVIAAFVPARPDESTRAAHEILDSLERLTRHITQRYPDIETAAGLLRALAQLRALPFDTASLRALQSAATRARIIEELLEEGPRALRPALEKLTFTLRGIRNGRIQGAAPAAQIPAHSLNEDEDD
jgi:transcriptional regulator with XRE-family HTH domain